MLPGASGSCQLYFHVLAVHLKFLSSSSFGAEGLGKDILRFCSRDCASQVAGLRPLHLCGDSANGWSGAIFSVSASVSASVCIGWTDGWTDSSGGAAGPHRSSKAAAEKGRLLRCSFSAAAWEAAAASISSIERDFGTFARKSGYGTRVVVIRVTCTLEGGIECCGDVSAGDSLAPDETINLGTILHTNQQTNRSNE